MAEILLGLMAVKVNLPGTELTVVVLEGVKVALLYRCSISSVP